MSMSNPLPGLKSTFKTNLDTFFEQNPRFLSGRSQNDISKRYNFIDYYPSSVGEPYALPVEYPARAVFEETVRNEIIDKYLHKEIDSRRGDDADFGENEEDPRVAIRARAWAIFDMIHESPYKVLPCTVSDFAVYEDAPYKVKIPVHGEQVMNARVFLYLINDDKIDISNYNQQDIECLETLRSNGSALNPFESIFNNELFMTRTEEEEEWTRKDGYIRTLSRQFVADMEFYTNIEHVFSTFKAWLSIVDCILEDVSGSEEGKKDSTYDEEKDLDRQHTVLDDLAFRTLHNFKQHDSQNPCFRYNGSLVFSEFARAFPAKGARGTALRVVYDGLTIEMRTWRKIATWQYHGIKKEHYEFRAYEVFDSDGRLKYTRERVRKRLEDAITQVESSITLIMLLLELLVSSDVFSDDTRGMFRNIMSMRVDTLAKMNSHAFVCDPGSSIPALGERFPGSTLAREGMVDFDQQCIALHNWNIQELWVLDTAIDMVGFEEKLTDVYRKDGKGYGGEVFYTDDPDNSSYEEIVRKGDHLKNTYFDVLGNYSPEQFAKLEEMGFEAMAIAYAYDLNVRSRTDRRVLDRYEWFVERTPWLRSQRFLRRERMEFDKYWSQIKELANKEDYDVPWLFYNDATGNVEDPRIGQSYGPPGSAQFESEMERRTKGIPSMFWYGSSDGARSIPRVRNMPNVDERRLLGTDGVLIAPPLAPPATDGLRYLQWKAEWEKYKGIVEEYGSIAKLAMAASARTPSDRLVGSEESTARFEAYASPGSDTLLSRWRSVVDNERGRALKSREVVRRQATSLRDKSLRLAGEAEEMKRTVEEFDKMQSGTREEEEEEEEKKKVDFRKRTYDMYDRIRDERYVFEYAGQSSMHLGRINIDMEIGDDMKHSTWIRDDDDEDHKNHEFGLSTFEYATKLRWSYIQSRRKRFRTEEDRLRRNKPEKVEKGDGSEESSDGYSSEEEGGGEETTGNDVADPTEIAASVVLSRAMANLHV